MFPGKRWEMTPPVTQEEVYLAARDKSKGKATAPEKMPVEVYRHLTGLHGATACIFTRMVEEN